MCSLGTARSVSVALLRRSGQPSDEPHLLEEVEVAGGCSAIDRQVGHEVAEHELVAGDSGDPLEETRQALVIDGVVRFGQRLGDDAAQVVAAPSPMIGA